MKPNDIALRVNGLSKAYRIAHDQEKHITLAETILSRLKNPLRRMATETFWALKDVNFEIKKGEVVGIIGRNGAGKSTLLKVLSRITEPTTGEVDVYGRVGSLLEVGTGFHPELTGRENVYLNGAILGMSKAEIRRQFDAIVEFAGVEQFLDTPVKRYSSGMYVRLAFSVAAHLNPEILIVDEVLAVGDATFQEKCLGKMQDVSRSGRTVLFVSHNMQAVARLTNRCILMSAGKVAMEGPTADCVARYLVAGDAQGLPGRYQASEESARKTNYLVSAVVQTSRGHAIHDHGQPITFEFEFQINQPSDGMCFSFQVVTASEQPICHFWQFEPDSPLRGPVGRYRLRCHVEKYRLFMGRYTLNTYLSDRRGNLHFENLSGLCPFHVSMDLIPRREYDWHAGDCAYVEDAQWLAG